MSLLRAGVSFALLIICASVSQAAQLYAVHYTGILGPVPEELSSAFAEGATVVGDFTFVGIPPRADSLDDAAVYDNLRSFRLEIDRIDTSEHYVAEFTDSPDGREIQIEDGTETNGRTDRILVLGLRSSGLIGPEINGFVIDAAGPHVEDLDNTAISGIGLPAVLNLDDFEVKTIGITFTDSFPVFTEGQVGAAALVDLSATLTSVDIRLQQVPEPSTLVMLSTGACTLIGVVIRRRRSRASPAA